MVSKKLYTYRKNKGLCVNCGDSNLYEDSIVRCEKHFFQDKKNKRNSYLRNKSFYDNKRNEERRLLASKGFCVNCHQKSDFGIRCSSCEQKHLVANRKYSAKNSIYNLSSIDFSIKLRELTS